MNLTNLAVMGALTGLLFSATDLGAQTVLPQDAVSRVLTLKDVKATPARISGVVMNHTPHTIRDLELLIQYHWLWDNERSPGQHSPGRAVTVKLDRQLAPGESMPFDYTHPVALPERNDGRFMTEVDVGAFTTVVPQQARLSK